MDARVRVPVLASALLALLPSCSPIYSFQFPSTRQPGSDATEMRARLEALLQSQGFQSLGPGDRASGDIGCGRTAPDRTTYEKGWRATGFLASDHWLWVHEFECDGAWWVVIVSSSNAGQPAAQLRDAVSAEFSREIASGALRLETRYRIALE